VTSVRVRLWYALLISFVACIAVAVGSVAYSSIVQRRNDQRWCALLVQLTDAQRATPPPTASGRKFAAELENLRREFHC
jgi:hypothetical protein